MSVPAARARGYVLHTDISKGQEVARHRTHKRVEEANAEPTPLDGIAVQEEEQYREDLVALLQECRQQEREHAIQERQHETGNIQHNVCKGRLLRQALDKCGIASALTDKEAAEEIRGAEDWVSKRLTRCRRLGE